MKAVVYSPAALARFADILGYTIERFGAAQTDVHAVRLAGRLKALASGHGPKARPCERLVRGVREASGLTCLYGTTRHSFDWRLARSRCTCRSDATPISAYESW